MTTTLVTIGPSHFCEKARWAMDIKGVPYVEDAHVPMFHWRRLRRHGVRTVPVVETDGQVLTHSTAIVAWADEVGTRGPRLLPEDPVARAEVERQVALWDDKVGAHARRPVYQAILPSASVTAQVFEGCPSWELVALRAGFPIWRSLLVRGLGITPDKCARSQVRLIELFREASDLLDKSGAYLAGDTLTASDLTFASLSAIVLQPREYGWPLPDFDALVADGRLPDGQAAITFRDTLRATPAGQHAMRLYRERRRP